VIIIISYELNKFYAMYKYLDFFGHYLSSLYKTAYGLLADTTVKLLNTMAA
jgi:hypothetical protein